MIKVGRLYPPEMRGMSKRKEDGEYFLTFNYFEGIGCCSALIPIFSLYAALSNITYTLLFYSHFHFHCPKYLTTTVIIFRVVKTICDCANALNDIDRDLEAFSGHLQGMAVSCLSKENAIVCISVNIHIHIYYTCMYICIYSMQFPSVSINQDVEYL